MPESIEPLPEGMLDGFVAPNPSGGPIEHVQTHISHLFLTRDRVYKIRKAVRFPFVDFSSRAARNRDCVDEVRLNRRLSPDVYLGVASIEPRGSRWQPTQPAERLAAGDPLEHCVVMRRLPDGGDAQTLLRAGRLTPAHLAGVANRVAAFHQAHRLDPSQSTRDDWAAHVSAPMLETLELVESEAGESQIRRRAIALADQTRKRLAAAAPAIEARRRNALAVDGHGDLQLAHVWFEGDPSSPRIIDCTEFNRDFRRIDAACEVAFLAMDLEYRGHRALADYFLAQYARRTDDYDLYRLVDLYASYRAAVRAKVALLAAQDASIDAAQRSAARHSAAAHLTLAEAFLAPKAKGALFVICGVVGSGKSTLADALAETLGAASIGSDLTRKRLAGLRADDHRAAGSAPRTGLYAESRTDEVYAGLLERADAVVPSGRAAVLDATFARRSQREAARRWASARDIPAYLIEARCDPQVALERLRVRAAQGSNPSDAGPDFYAWSAEHFEPPDEWPRDERSAIRMDTDAWRQDLENLTFVRG